MTEIIQPAKNPARQTFTFKCPQCGREKKSFNHRDKYLCTHGTFDITYSNPRVMIRVEAQEAIPGNIVTPQGINFDRLAYEANRRRKK